MRTRAEIVGTLQQGQAAAAEGDDREQLLVIDMLAPCLILEVLLDIRDLVGGKGQLP